MTPDVLAALELHCKSATPAPWKASHVKDFLEVFTITSSDVSTICELQEDEPGTFDHSDLRGQIADDFAFIAAARAAVPAMVKRIRELEAEVEELVGENAMLRGEKVK